MSNKIGFFLLAKSDIEIKCTSKVEAKRRLENSQVSATPSFYMPVHDMPAHDSFQSYPKVSITDTLRYIL